MIVQSASGQKRYWTICNLICSRNEKLMLFRLNARQSAVKVEMIWLAWGHWLVRTIGLLSHKWKPAEENKTSMKYSYPPPWHILFNKKKKKKLKIPNYQKALGNFFLKIKKIKIKIKHFKNPKLSKGTLKKLKKKKNKSQNIPNPKKIPKNPKL